MHKVRRSFGRSFIVAAAVLGLAVAASAQTQEWKSYSYPADGFSATFPLAPDLQKRDVPTEKGSFELRSYIAEVSPVALFVGMTIA